MKKTLCSILVIAISSLGLHAMANQIDSVLKSTHVSDQEAPPLSNVFN